MQRVKKVVLVSHCILNQNSVVHPLARAKGPLVDVILPLIENNLAIVQLPCPETLHLGLDRPPMEYNEYNTSEYKALCQKLSLEQHAFIERLILDECEVIAMIGISESPTCSQTGIKGHFMETLHPYLPEGVLKIDVGADDPVLSQKDLCELIERSKK